MFPWCPFSTICKVSMYTLDNSLKHSHTSKMWQHVQDSISFPYLYHKRMHAYKYSITYLNLTNHKVYKASFSKCSHFDPESQCYLACNESLLEICIHMCPSFPPIKMHFCFNHPSFLNFLFQATKS